jgi:hypothetical protein
VDTHGGEAPSWDSIVLYGGVSKLLLARLKGWNVQALKGEGGERNYGSSVTINEEQKLRERVIIINNKVIVMMMMKVS